MSDESDIPLGRRGLWELSRSSDALAKGIGCDETNPRRIGVMPLVQPVFSVEDVIQRGIYPRWSIYVTRAAVAGVYAVVQFTAFSELRFVAITATYTAGAAVRYLVTRDDMITADRNSHAVSDSYANLPSRVLVESGTRPNALNGPEFKTQSNSSLPPLIIPAGARLVLGMDLVNQTLQAGADCEERDGRVIMPDSA